MFGNSQLQYKNKHIMGNMSIFENNEIHFTIEKMNEIEKKYTNPLANKQYQNISPDLIEYSLLYDEINKMCLKTKNENIRLLFKISLQGLTGAINAFHLNKQIIENNMNYLSEQNRLANREINQVFENTSEQITITQTFTLAPLYSYYILLFGVPKEGFEPIKIKQILDILNEYRIDPYY